MKFFIQKPLINQNFSLIYHDNDYSFDIEPLSESGDTSILINDLQLEIDHKGRIIYVWGLCPLIEYEETNQFPQNYETKSLVAQLEKTSILGMPFRLNAKNRWPLYINKRLGWVCIGDQKIQDMQMIEFAPNCVATLKENEIIAIWLHPKKLPEF